MYCTLPKVKYIRCRMQGLIEDGKQERSEAHLGLALQSSQNVGRRVYNAHGLVLPGDSPHYVGCL